MSDQTKGALTPTVARHIATLVMDVWSAGVGAAVDTGDVLWQAGDGSANESGPAVTLGMPNCLSHTVDDLLRYRIVWWPGGVCRRRRIGLMSSRIGRRRDQYTWWHDLLRTAVLRIDRVRECLCAVSGTTAAESVERAAQLFGIPLMAVTIEDGCLDAVRLSKWLLQQSALAPMQVSDPEQAIQRAVVSPRLVVSSQAAPDPSVFNVPVRDVAQHDFSHRIFVLACRDHGNVEQILRRRSESDPKLPIICLAAGSGTSDRLFEELTTSGAIPWFVDGLSESGATLCASFSHAGLNFWPSLLASTDRTRIDSLVGGPVEHPADWFCHWTRPRTGPWPGQGVHDYLDELILGCATADRSALAALLRMVSDQMIVASNRTIRGDAPVVSFTETPLAEFRRRRVYRHHRHRYDFEPWGIAVRRDVLIGVGAQRVEYVPANNQTGADEVDSTWIQPMTDRTGTLDWTSEREWRLPGNLDLSRLPDSAVWCFVNEAREANVIACQCGWRVVVVP